MAIKIGFSTSVCPDWDIQKIARQAGAAGFYGVELAALHGQVHLPEAPGLKTDQQIEVVRNLFAANDVELVGLSCQDSVETPSRRLQERATGRIIEHIELAAKLGCPFVRLPMGRTVAFEPAGRTLGRLIAPLAELAAVAFDQGVTLLLCNGGAFPDSKSLWVAVDGVSHPGLKGAWNPVNGLGVRENSTLAVPRLGGMLKMFMACDARFSERGEFRGYTAVGDGAVDYAKTIDLLKGVVFDGYLMLDWPKVTNPMLPDPGGALPAALRVLLERIKHSDPVLTAYKGDKNPPNYGDAPKAFVERKAAAAAGESTSA